ncbi:uncharacterized protein LOC135811609 [Sycon ciliatum]|uniref:uncharacterized protein LOC135811609 n=1 Tax=Sycon ciliatum TaxID=27933 RepID=UPI0031F6866D
MVSISVYFQTEYSWIVLVTTLVVITTEVWCLTPSCRPVAHRQNSYEGLNGGLQTFKWYTSHSPGTLSYRVLGYNPIYSINFEFQGSCTIAAIGISFTAAGNCHFYVRSKSFDHGGWSNARSVRFSDSSKYGSSHNLNFSVQSSHGMQIKFTVQSAPSPPLSQCAIQLNKAREPFIALHVHEDHDECSASYNPCYGYTETQNSGPHCHNTWGSYRCTCQHGYKLTQDGTIYTCNDIDECVEADNPCYGYIRSDNEPGCVNTAGSYTCVCREGYEIIDNGTLLQCLDIDECSITPHHCVAYSAKGPRRCVNSMGSYSCNCVEGFAFQDTPNSTECLQVDECNSGTHSCNNKTNDDNRYCQNFNGSYDCPCLPGYNGADCDAMTPSTSSHQLDMAATRPLSRDSDPISIAVQSTMIKSTAQPEASYTLYISIGSIISVLLFVAALVIIIAVRRRKKNSAPPENSRRTVCVRRDPSNTTDLTENELYILQAIPENGNISQTFTGNSNDGPLPVIPITPVRALTTINPVYEESTCLQPRGSTKTVSTQQDASDYLEIL